MFTVRCPTSAVWHPAVHHSLLLLRALKQSHTLLLLDPPTSNDASTSTGLSASLLSLQASRVMVCAPPSESGPPQLPLLEVVRRPEHILHFFSRASHRRLPAEIESRVEDELPSYLEAAVVCEHIHSTVDALLIAMSTEDMESTRQLHAALMDAVEGLETSLSSEAAPTELSSYFQQQQQGPASSATTGEPRKDCAKEEELSTWPLLATLQFLIEEGGLLQSAFPRLSAEYAKLVTQSPPVRQHTRLVQRTVDSFAQAESAKTSAWVDRAVVLAHPRRGFLVDVQHRLRAYTTSVEEQVTEGVVGDKGPLTSRVSGARMGIQAVPARLPWTMQRRPLKQRQ